MVQAKAKEGNSTHQREEKRHEAGSRRQEETIRPQRQDLDHSVERDVVTEWLFGEKLKPHQTTRERTQIPVKETARERHKHLWKKPKGSGLIIIGRSLRAV